MSKASAEIRPVIGLVLSLVGDEKEPPEVVEAALRVIVNCVWRNTSTHANKPKQPQAKTPLKSKQTTPADPNTEDHILKRVWRSVR